MLRLLIATFVMSVSLTLGCCESTLWADPTHPADPADPPAAAPPVHLTEPQKIERLLGALESSEAMFIRNGEEHSGKEAAAHLRSKLAAAGGLIPSARAFIEQLASVSSASGKPYMVRPKGGEPVESRQWFMAQLATMETPITTGTDRPARTGRRRNADAAASPAVPAIPVAAGDLGKNVKITVDCVEAEDLKEWGEKSKEICEKQYPIICQLLNSEGFVPRDSVTIKFVPDMRAPAATGGGTISVSAKYVREHMGDYGMMVHELTHVVQAYHRGRPNTGWITEGIADYIRFHKYEPGADHSRIDTKKATYHDSYRTTARFLAYVNDKYDKDFVKKLNALMRQGEGDETSFKAIVGKDVDELWKEFVEKLDAERTARSGSGRQ